MKESIFREIIKLISILNQYGDVLVPPIDGQQQTHATDKLEYLVLKLQNEFNMSIEEIDEQLQTFTHI